MSQSNHNFMSSILNSHQVDQKSSSSRSDGSSQCSDAIPAPGDEVSCPLCGDSLNTASQTPARRLIVHFNSSHFPLTTPQKQRLSELGFQLRSCAKCRQTFEERGFNRHRCQQARNRGESKPTDSATRPEPSFSRLEPNDHPISPESKDPPLPDSSPQTAGLGLGGAASSAQQSRTLYEWAKHLTIEDIVSLAPLMHRIPKTLQPIYVASLEPICSKINRAASANRLDELETSTKMLILAIILALRAKNPSTAEGSIKRQLDRAEKLVRDSVCGAQQPNLSREDIFGQRPTNPTPAEEEMEACDRAERLLRQGHIAKATRALDQAKLAPLDSNTINELHRLHPQSSEPMPSLPEDTPTVHIEPSPELAAFIRRQASKGAAAGLTGISANHLSPLLRSQTCFLTLATILTHVTAGTLSPSTRQLFTASRGIALTKPNGKVRPIAIGDVFYRIGAGWLIKQNLEQIKSACGQNQLGYGKQGGVEAMSHLLTIALLSDKPTAVIKCDVTNAFNTASRRQILESVFSRPELACLWRLVHTAYNEPSSVLFLRPDRSIATIICSSEGVKQGCAVGTAAFDVLLRRPVEAALANQTEATAHSVHDDICLVGPPDQLPQIFDKLKVELEKQGSIINTSKCAFAMLHPAEHLPMDTDSWLHNTGMTFCSSAFEIVGSVIAKSAEHAQPALASALESNDRFFKRLASPHLRAQSAQILNRFCGLPRFNYLARCTLPSRAGQIFTAFDERIRQVLCAKMHLPQLHSNSHPAQQAQLPLRLGGLGLRSFAQLQPIAWFSSVALTAPILNQSPLLPACPRFHSELQHIANSLRQHANDILPELLPLLPEQGQDAIQFYCANVDKAQHLQHKLTPLVDKPIAQNLSQAAAQADRIRLDLLLDKITAAFLEALPTEQSKRLNDQQFQRAIQLRLNLPLPSPDTCIDCGQNLRRKPDPFHALNCVKLRRTSINDRHDEIVSLLVEFIKLAGGQARAEKRPLTGSKLRPDITATLNGQLILIDVVVSNPLAPSHQRHFHATNDQAARHKHRKYDPVATRLNARLFAFAINIFGNIHEEGLALLKEILRHAAAHSRDDQLSKHSMVQRVSCALQRQNAQIFLDHEERCARKQREQEQRPTTNQRPPTAPPQLSQASQSQPQPTGQQAASPPSSTSSANANSPAQPPQQRQQALQQEHAQAHQQPQQPPLHQQHQHAQAHQQQQQAQSQLQQAQPQQPHQAQPQQARRHPFHGWIEDCDDEEPPREAKYPPHAHSHPSSDSQQQQHQQQQQTSPPSASSATPQQSSTRQPPTATDHSQAQPREPSQQHEQQQRQPPRAASNANPSQPAQQPRPESKGADNTRQQQPQPTTQQQTAQSARQANTTQTSQSDQTASTRPQNRPQPQPQQPNQPNRNQPAPDSARTELKRPTAAIDPAIQWQQQADITRAADRLQGTDFGQQLKAKTALQLCLDYCDLKWQAGQPRPSKQQLCDAIKKVGFKRFHPDKTRNTGLSHAELAQRDLIYTTLQATREQLSKELDAEKEEEQRVKQALHQGMATLGPRRRAPHFYSRRYSPFSMFG